MSLVTTIRTDSTQARQTLNVLSQAGRSHLRLPALAHITLSTPVNPVVPSEIGSAEDVANFVGVFGANWLFVIPTEGDEAGEVIPFAYGPARCEMTGPKFVGNTLLLSMQHPSENSLFTPPAPLNRDIEMLNLDGALFTQNRTVPRGSNWPSNLEGLPAGPPRPSVIGVVRKNPRRNFFQQHPDKSYRRYIMRKGTWQRYFCKVMLLAILATCSLWQPAIANTIDCRQDCGDAASACRGNCQTLPPVEKVVCLINCNDVASDCVRECAATQNVCILACP